MLRKILVILFRGFLLLLFQMIGFVVMYPFLPSNLITAIGIAFIVLISAKSNIWKVNSKSKRRQKENSDIGGRFPKMRK